MNIRLCALNAAGGVYSHAQTTAGEHMGMAAKHAMPSTTLVVTLDGKAITLTQADLQVMPQKSLTVHNGHSSLDETYTGVPVAELLAKLGFALQTTRPSGSTTATCAPKAPTATGSSTPRPSLNPCCARPARWSRSPSTASRSPTKAPSRSSSPENAAPPAGSAISDPWPS